MIILDLLHRLIVFDDTVYVLYFIYIIATMVFLDSNLECWNLKYLVLLLLFFMAKVHLLSFLFGIKARIHYKKYL